jgi:hypothetical protein
MKWDFIGGGLGVEAIGIALFVALPPPWWPKMPTSLVHLGISSGIVLGSVGLALIVVGILPTQLENRTGPFALLAFAIGLGISSLMWWHWIGASPEEADNDVSLDGRILVECTDAALPTTMPANGKQIYSLSVHPAAQQAQLGRFILPAGAPVNWGIKSLAAYKCEVTNFSSSVVARLVIPFKVQFFKNEKTDTGTRAGDLIKEEDQPMPIPALRENGSEVFEFYIRNNSDLFATVFVPAEASAWVVGDDQGRTVKLMKPTFYRGLSLFPLEWETAKDSPQLPAVTQAQPVELPVPETGAIIWDNNKQFLVVTGGGPSAQINSILLQGDSTRAVSFKAAYAISGRTGHKQDLVANVQSQGAYYPVTDVDIPPKAAVWLELIFKPPLSITEFSDQWGALSVTMAYQDGTTYTHNFDETYVRDKLERMVPNAIGPRVTPRQNK